MSATTTVAIYAGEARLGKILDACNAEGSDHCVTLLGSTVVLPVERKFASLESIQAYVDRVLDLPSIEGRYHPAHINVRERKGQMHAHYQPFELGGEIAIPLVTHWALRETIVLHEIAHHLAPGDGHGPQFKAALLDLLRIVMAPEVAFVLQVCWE